MIKKRARATKCSARMVLFTREYATEKIKKNNTDFLITRAN